MSELNRKVSEYFDKKISEEYNLQSIKLIEGLLLLSMLPLHRDSLKKQLAFYVVGLSSLNEVFDEINTF